MGKLPSDRMKTTWSKSFSKPIPWQGHREEVNLHIKWIWRQTRNVLWKKFFRTRLNVAIISCFTFVNILNCAHITSKWYFVQFLVSSLRYIWKLKRSQCLLLSQLRTTFLMWTYLSAKVNHFLSVIHGASLLSTCVFSYRYILSKASGYLVGKKAKRIIMDYICFQRR